MVRRADGLSGRVYWPREWSRSRFRSATPSRPLTLDDQDIATDLIADLAQSDDVQL